MRTLFIDTHNTRSFSVAFDSEAQFSFLSGNDAASELIHSIDSLSSNSIEKIVIITGPGSLTGLRIGSSFAQGIALAKNIQVLGISVWDLLLTEFPLADIFFFTGTKKWIKKNSKEEIIIERDFHSEAPYWISNNPSLLNDLDITKNVPFPSCIELMYKHVHKASDNIDLLYPINLFNS